MSKAFGSKYSIETSKEAEEFYHFIKDLMENDVVCEMKNFRHHYSTTCYQHCINVAYYNYIICRKLGLDARKAARAGLLHDLYLYDWRDQPRKRGEKPHGMRHPGIALENAKLNFDISKREEDIIVKHMWPLTLKLPRYAESYVIVVTDKYAAMLEIGSHLKGKLKGLGSKAKDSVMRKVS
ncbi:MAG: HDIG domain-containing protein [Ruminococcus sp.]|nr:HDIG domain-containing protein [Ruminococcus sp.]